MEKSNSIDRFACKKQNLVCGLIYPAMLGTILCSFIANVADLPQLLHNWQSCVLMMVVLAFYSTDYLYTLLHSRMSWESFIGNLLLVFLMFLAFNAINFTQGNQNLYQYNLCLAATFLVFVYFDHKCSDDYGVFTKSVVIFELILASVFVGCGIYGVGIQLTMIVATVSYFCMIYFAATAYYHDRILELTRYTKSQIGKIFWEFLCLPKGAE